LTGDPLLKLVRAIPREHRMRVRVDESGHYDSPVCVDDFGVRPKQRFDFSTRSSLSDASIANQHRAVFENREVAKFRSAARPRRPR
jgi:hypothetical protein